VFRLCEDGVYRVFSSEESSDPLYFTPTIKDYYQDMDYILNVISDGPTKSFAYRRLRYLESKFHMYTLLNEYQEMADSKVNLIYLLKVSEYLIEIFTM
jgi:AMP deaminase